jgi:hypothetical protein
MYHDLWVGPKFDLTIRPKRSVTRVSVHGWVPEEIPIGGKLTLRVIDQVRATDLRPGTFTLFIEMPEGVNELIPVTVEATKWLTPQGPDRRMLAFVLLYIELEHPA